MDNHFVYFVRRCFSCCAVQALIFLSLFVPCFADEVDSSSGAAPGDSVVDDSGSSFTEITNTTEVYILPDDIDISQFVEAGPDAYDVYEVFSDPDVIPRAAGDDFPFYGSAWAVGSASGLGSDLKLFFPINRKDYIGVDSSGRLFNVSDTSFSGVLYDGNSSYTVSFGGFSYPRYRESVGSSWDYETLYFVPTESNLVLVNAPASAYSLSDLLPWVCILILGGILLCSMRKS